MKQILFYFKQISIVISHLRYKCTVGAQQLVSESKTIIYEPFIKYTDEAKESATVLHAVPILIKGNLVYFNKVMYCFFVHFFH